MCGRVHTAAMKIVLSSYEIILSDGTPASLNVIAQVVTGLCPVTSTQWDGTRMCQYSIHSTWVFI